MDDALKTIRAFIGADPVRGTNCFMVSSNQAGLPSIRQVSAYIEGWTVYTVTQSRSLKVKHLRENPSGSYLWVDEGPARRRKNVWIRGNVTIVEDQDEVAEFMERRAQTLGMRVPERDWHRLVLRLEPDYLRAEGFLGEEAGNTPVILKEFSI